MKHRIMEITHNTSDPNGARIIIACNGYEIDVRSDEDGIVAEITKEGRGDAYCSVSFDDGEEKEA